VTLPPSPESVAGVPAMVLAEIGGRALGAVNRGRAVVIGERLRKGTRAVIVEVADLVGERIQANVVVVMAVVMMEMMPMVVMAVVMGSGLRQPGIQGQQSQNGAGRELQVGHLVPPVNVKIRHFRRSGVPSSAWKAR
jgi:hypothetical protein